jgi:hypothetical protein
MFRDIIYELAAVGDLPLPQPSPPTSNKRERNADEPISSTPSEASTSTTLSDQHVGPRAMVGNSRLRKDSSISMPTDQQFSASSQSPDHRGSTAPQVPSPSQHGSGLRSRQPSQSQLNAEQSSSMPPPGPPAPRYYTLPVYSDDLGRLPIHGQLSFAEQAHTQLKPPQPPHKPTQFWSLPGADSASEDPSMGTGVVQAQMSIGYGHNASQQAGPSTTAGNFPSRYNPMSEMSTMAPGPRRGYGGDAAALAAGMMFDTLAYTHNQQTQRREQQQQQQQQQAHHQSIYGIGPMDPSGLMPGSMPMQPSESYRTRAVDGLVEQQQQQQQQQQQAIGRQQQAMPNMGFTGFVDNDTMAMWTNAPTGFECVMLLNP